MLVLASVATAAGVWSCWRRVSEVRDLATMSPSPDGVFVARCHYRDGAGASVVDKSCHGEFIEVDASGKWWSDWFGNRDIVFTSLRDASRVPAVIEWHGVRIETRALPSRREVLSPGGNVLRIWQYNDSRRMMSATIEVDGGTSGRVEETIVGEGAWRIDGTWLGDSVLKLRLESTSSEPAPDVPRAVSGVAIEREGD